MAGGVPDIQDKYTYTEYTRQLVKPWEEHHVTTPVV